VVHIGGLQKGGRKFCLIGKIIFSPYFVLDGNHKNRYFLLYSGLRVTHQARNFNKICPKILAWWVIRFFLLDRKLTMILWGEIRFHILNLWFHLYAAEEICPFSDFEDQYYKHREKGTTKNCTGYWWQRQHTSNESGRQLSIFFLIFQNFRICDIHLGSFF